MREDVKCPGIIKKGIFCREDKYRFHCWVNIDGQERLCYLPSNCKLEKISSLEGREVLLSRYVGDNSKFNYKVEAVLYRNGQILLNFNFLNRVVEQEIRRRKFSFLGERERIFREKYVCGYKSDLYIADTNTLIEIKSVLAFSKKVNYPVNYSSHMLQQLEKLHKITNEQTKVYYFIIGTGPAIKEINVDINSEYGKLMNKCKKSGVHFLAMNLQSRKGKYRVKEFVNINYITK